MLSLIPWYYKLAAVAAVLAVLMGGSWWNGAAYVQKKWDADKIVVSLEIANIKAQQAESSVKVVTEYVDRVKVVQGKTRTLIKEVDHYVTAQDDADCIVSDGLIKLHDEAVTIGPVPGATAYLNDRSPAAE